MRHPFALAAFLTASLPACGADLPAPVPMSAPVLGSPCDLAFAACIRPDALPPDARFSCDMGTVPDASVCSP